MYSSLTRGNWGYSGSVITIPFLEKFSFLIGSIKWKQTKTITPFVKDFRQVFHSFHVIFKFMVRSLICLLLLLFILIFCFRFLSMNSEMTSLKLNWIIFLFISTINFAMLFVSTLPGTCDSLIWGLIWQLVVYKKDSRSLGKRATNKHLKCHLPYNVPRLRV